MNNATVAILMGTYQGERYLPAQLQSFLAQTHPGWTLWVSDDGSRDGTLPLLEAFRREHHPALRLLHGPRRGFSRNFLSMVCNQDIHADYYAFADQDDVWHADKLERALSWLRQQPAGIPALYCTRTHLVNERGESIGHSPLWTRAPGFANALVQNLGSGNTMVMNHAARKLLQQAGPDIDVEYHDWWSYLAVAGVGGRVRYDPAPSLDYRQHGGNLVGGRLGWQTAFPRLSKLARGRYRNRNTQHLLALQRIKHLLTPENREILGLFQQMRSAGPLARMWMLRRAGLYRQSRIANTGLLLAALLKCI